MSQNIFNNIKNWIGTSFTSFFAFLRKPFLPYKLYSMLMRGFLYWFLIAQGLFLIIFLIFDFFSKVYSYIDNSVSTANILLITFLLAPKAIWLTMPVAIMFGIIMAIATLYQNNELVAIFTAGISIYKLVLPLILFNLILSLCMIFIDSFIVIPAFRYRENLYEYLTSSSKDKYNVTIKGKNNYFWNIFRFVPSNNSLINIRLFKVNENFNIIVLLEAESAIYTKNGWVFKSGIIREWDDDGFLKNEKKFYKYHLNDLEEDPKTFKDIFKKSEYDIEKMTIFEAQKRLKLLKELGIDYTTELLNYHKKFSFPFTLLIVCLIAIGVSTLSQKNILILALFFSIGLAIIYYVFQLIINSMTAGGKINPIIGAWLPIIIFVPIGIYLVKIAKT